MLGRIDYSIICAFCLVSLACDQKHQNLGSSPAIAKSSSPHVVGSITPSHAPNLIVKQPAWDFGTILATGQTLRHEFVVANRSQSPVNLREARAFTPCCSSIGPIPSVIEPNGEVKVPISFNTGSYSGFKRVEFTVETDSDSSPVLWLSASARLVPEWEVRPLGEAAIKVPLNRASLRAYKVVCRSKGTEGRTAAFQVEAQGAIDVDNVSEAVLLRTPDGVVTESREIIVRLRRFAQPCTSRAELAFHWPDGKIHRFPIVWQVVPSLRVAPSGFTLDRSKGTTDRVIAIHANDVAFRILKVSGLSISCNDPLPTRSATRHLIHVSLDTSRIDSGIAHDVRLLTDHPDQSEAIVSVIVLTNPTGGNE